MADGLYGKKTSKLKGKEISSTNSLSFTSSLSSLISKSSAKQQNEKKPLNTKEKSDIFTAHKKSAKKRAAKELEDERGQTHKTKDEIGNVSATDLHRSKRRMEDKVRMYNAMKRGEYVQRGDGYDDRGLVDFDRKWAEKDNDSDQTNDSDDSDNDPASNEIVEYTDEFGRQRKGTRKEAENVERQARIQANAKADADNFAAHPQAPTNIIYGDAVQHEAFDPDRTIVEQMAELAKKRDRSATPPASTHFDANAEIRTKGTGFYTFSHDVEGRKREMDDLEKARLETEIKRKEKSQLNDLIEQSPKIDQSLNRDAEKFLDEFQPSDE